MRARSGHHLLKNGEWEGCVHCTLFQHISAMNSAVSTACVDGFEACPYRYSKISKTELRPASLPPYKDCITKQIGNPGSVAYASWPVCLTGLTLLRLVHVPDGSSFLQPLSQSGCFVKLFGSLHLGPPSCPDAWRQVQVPNTDLGRLSTECVRTCKTW